MPCTGRGSEEEKEDEEEEEEGLAAKESARVVTGWFSRGSRRTGESEKQKLTGGTAGRRCESGKGIISANVAEGVRETKSLLAVGLPDVIETTIKCERTAMNACNNPRLFCRGCGIMADTNRGSGDRRVRGLPAGMRRQGKAGR